MALGVAFSIAANLGTSPISSVPYMVSLLVPLSVGEVTIAMHCTFILLQIILQKRIQDGAAASAPNSTHIRTNDRYCGLNSLLSSSIKISRILDFLPIGHSFCCNRGECRSQFGYNSSCERRSFLSPLKETGNKIW